MSTRGNDPDRTGRVIVMQRLHERDLSGHVLEQGGYEHLCLPMRYESDRRCITSLGFEDPRSSENELLWPGRVSEESLEELEKRLGTYASAGQLQQRPAPRGGGLFQRQWFKIVNAAPAQAARIRFWDMASTDESKGSNPCYTVGALVSFSGGVTYIEDVRRVRLSPQGVESTIRQTAQLDGTDIPIWIEQEPGSSGVTVIDHYQRLVLPEYACRGDRPTGSKEARATPLASAAEAGNVCLVRGAWNEEFLREAETFPAGKFKDQVDAVSGGRSKVATASTGLTW
jgi:predicted phage terminase large subunit-like protein